MRTHFRADLAAARSKREAVAAFLVNLSRVVPGGGLLLWGIGADIPAKVRIGAGVRFPHGAMAVVIHPSTVIGERVIIYHGVTLGEVDKTHAAPVVADDVLIGVGATVLGGVTLGRGCRVGARALVTHDVPPGATVVGINDVRWPTQEGSPALPNQDGAVSSD